jgi:hypothetical protein
MWIWRAGGAGVCAGRGEEGIGMGMSTMSISAGVGSCFGRVLDRGDRGRIGRHEEAEAKERGEEEEDERGEGGGWDLLRVRIRDGGWIVRELRSRVETPSSTAGMDRPRSLKAYVDGEGGGFACNAGLGCFGCFCGGIGATRAFSLPFPLASGYRKVMSKVQSDKRRTTYCVVILFTLLAGGDLDHGSGRQGRRRLALPRWRW